jgi:hypothetical protein
MLGKLEVMTLFNIRKKNMSKANSDGDIEPLILNHL